MTEATMRHFALPLALLCLALPLVTQAQTQPLNDTGHHPVLRRHHHGGLHQLLTTPQAKIATMDATRMLAWSKLVRGACRV
ncbi:hypothetical protein [Melaminivora sp.]